MDGTEEQRRTYLPKIATGEYIFSFALTEPGAGSDAASLKTSAVLDGDHYVINGTKRFITNAVRAQGFTLMARTDAANKGAGGISAFIVPRDTPGITLGKIDKKMGQRGTKTCDVIFENARVPAANTSSAAASPAWRLQDGDEGTRPRPPAHLIGLHPAWPGAC